MGNQHYFILAALLVVVTANGRGGFDSSRIKKGGLQDFDGEDSMENQLHRDEFVENREHLKEHLTDAKIDIDNASKEELQFHFFKLHDTNDDKQLDGLELLHAVGHGLAEQIDRVREKEDATAEDKAARIDRMKARRVDSVDRILKDADKNEDGYLSYPEYADSRKMGNIAKQKLREMQKAEEKGY